MKSPGRIERFLLRPLFLLITFTLVVFAIAQFSGRLFMASLHLFSEQIDQLAKTQNVRVKDVRGGWSRFNPRIEVGQVVFAGVYVDQGSVEIDVLESIWRNALVIRELTVGEVVLDLAQSNGRWALRGGRQTRIDFDPMPTLKASDQISANVRILLTNGSGVSSEARGQVLILNHGGVHHAQVKLDELELQAWMDDSGYLDSEQSSLVLAGGSWSLPKALVPDTEVLQADAIWRGDKESGAGRVKVLARSVLPDVESPAEFVFGSRFKQETESSWSGLIDELVISVADDDLALDQGRFRVLASPEGLDFEFWQQLLDLSQINDFIARNLSAENAAGAWTRAAGIGGTAHNVRVFVTPETGLGYGATLADIAMQGHRGAPGVEGAQARLWGHTRGAALRINTEQASLSFPDLFTDTWRMEYLTGDLRAWFRGGYLGLKGSHLRTRIDGSSVAGSFSLTRPISRFEQRVALDLKIDGAQLETARSFVPFKLPDDLAAWLSYGPIAGRFENARFSYQGHVHKQDESGSHRRIELAADLADMITRYERSWPLVENLHGQLHVAGREIRVGMDQATSLDLRLSKSSVVLINNAEYALLDLSSSAPGDVVLDFVRASPLKESLSFVSEQWKGTGQMEIEGAIRVPIKEEAPELSVELDFQFADVDLSMPEYRSHFGKLNGEGKFSLPHQLSGSFTGELFDAPATLKATSDTDWIYFDITGRGTPEHSYRMAALPELDVMAGDFPFAARLGLAMAENQITNLSMTSDLTGLEVTLPGPLAKAGQDVTPMELDVQFLEDYQSIRWAYKETQGWIHYSEQVDRGAIGVNLAPPMTDHGQQALTIRGNLDEVVLGDWVSGEGEAAVSLPLDWNIAGLDVDRLVIDELTFPSVRIQAHQAGDYSEFRLDSEELAGTIQLDGDAPVRITLDRVTLPAEEVAEQVENVLEAPDEEDPIPVRVGYNLPHAQVSVTQLNLGSEPFGSWRFLIEPQDNGVQFRQFGADVNGIHIEDAEVYWDLASNQSHFQGQIKLDDLSETLPKWSYAPVLSTERASVEADSSWSGSPANVSLLGLNGELTFAARDGRFFDVESGGGLRVMSLLNFSNVAKRISFDFSDVTKEGMPFDKIDARVNLREGRLSFLERMEVESTSSNFQIGGYVDLHSGTLNNEMIVTLPVSDSLPWYGFYLALANPLAGLGVLVGERVLRKPLRAFSTAKFAVTGTLDEPEVNFVGLWDRSMREFQERKAEESEDLEPEQIDERNQDIPADEMQLGGTP